MTKVLSSDNTDATHETDTTDTKEMPIANPLSGLTPGRIVHFVWPDKRHIPALIVTASDNGACELFAFPGTSGVSYPGFDAGAGCVFASFDNDAKPIGTWHWIERVD